MEARFAFYEVVRVATPRADPSLAGQVGTILGRAQNEQGQWSYAVAMRAQDDETRSFYEDELEATGEVESANRFYIGEHLRVIVDPTTGEGSIQEA